MTPLFLLALLQVYYSHICERGRGNARRKTSRVSFSSEQSVKISLTFRYQPKYVLDADISGCFDNISHTALLQKLHSYPAIQRTVKAWLKAGIMEDGGFHETLKGTPQGGVASPLLMNIALHGIERAIREAFSYKESVPQLVRYADDLVVLHPTEAGVRDRKAPSGNMVEHNGVRAEAQ